MSTRKKNHRANLIMKGIPSPPSPKPHKGDSSKEEGKPTQKHHITTNQIQTLYLGQFVKSMQQTIHLIKKSINEVKSDATYEVAQAVVGSLTHYDNNLLGHLLNQILSYGGPLVFLHSNSRIYLEELQPSFFMKRVLAHIYAKENQLNEESCYTQFKRNLNPIEELLTFVDVSKIYTFAEQQNNIQQLFKSGGKKLAQELYEQCKKLNYPFITNKIPDDLTILQQAADNSKDKLTKQQLAECAKRNPRCVSSKAATPAANKLANAMAQASSEVLIQEFEQAFRTAFNI